MCWEAPLLESNVHSYTVEDVAADEAAETYARTLDLHALSQGKIALSERGIAKFDLMVLGVGPDGHVASLLPAHPVLEEKEKWVSVVRDPTHPTRLTMTLPVINSASNIALVVAGATKANAVYSALKHEEDDRNASNFRLPVKMVSPEEGQVKWYLDKGAASKLFKEEIHMEKRY